MSTTLNHLGTQTSTPTESFDLIEWKHGAATIAINCEEFTSLCPVTKQPDFGRIVIEYVPDAHIVETKSLKLWLWRWRTRGQFNEEIVAEIAGAFFDQAKPLRVEVVGFFNTRGGISVNPRVTRQR